jgi:protein-disulfide isomerase
MSDALARNPTGVLMRRFLALCLTVAALFALPVQAEEKPTVALDAASTPALFNPEQRGEIETIIKEYLSKNPQVVVDALEAMQAQMQAKQEAETIAAIKANRDEIMNPTIPPLGNPDGDVTIVEFFDYKCGYCRSTHPVTQRLLEEDKNIRIIHKQFPILGHVSMQAARYALSARNQGKYEAMHNKLMDGNTQLELENLPQLAQEAGLDMDKLSKDLMSQDIINEIRLNLELAQKLSIRGTPAFIIGDKLYPGSMNLDGFKQAVAEARAAAKNPAPAANP